MLGAERIALALEYRGGSGRVDRVGDVGDGSREYTRHFPRKIDAQDWLDEVTADVVTGRYVDPQAGRIELGTFADRWLAAQTFDALTRETVESRIRVHVKPHLGEVELRNLRPSMIQAWVRVARSKSHRPTVGSY